MDSDLVERLYLRYWDRVEARCRCILDDPGEAADAAQEVFVQLIRRGGCFRGDASWMTWLYRVATNVSLNRLRSRRCRELQQCRNEPACAQGCVTLEDTLVARDALAALFEHFDHKTLGTALLYYRDELNQTEIARLMSVSRVAINRRLAKFRERTKTLLESRPGSRPQPRAPWQPGSVPTAAA